MVLFSDLHKLCILSKRFMRMPVVVLFFLSVFVILLVIWDAWSGACVWCCLYLSSYWSFGMLGLFSGDSPGDMIPVHNGTELCVCVCMCVCVCTVLLFCCF